jgi:hypothetical protein
MPVMMTGEHQENKRSENAGKIVQNDHGTDKATLAQTVAVP